MANDRSPKELFDLGSWRRWRFAERSPVRPGLWSWRKTLTYAACRLACRIAALVVIFVQLRKRHLPQREGQAVSSVLPINQYSHRFAHSDRSQTVDFYSTLERCRAVKGQSGVAAESCNSETSSSDQAMKLQCGERQASLKPALEIPRQMYNPLSGHFESRKLDITYADTIKVIG